MGTLLSGSSYNKTHQISVDSILKENSVQVYSKGYEFSNLDRWTGRFLLGCAIRSASSKKKLTSELIEDWVFQINSEKISHPQIVIARTPDSLPSGVARVLIGGAYHEAFHTKYSCKRDINLDEVEYLFKSWWDEFKWKKYAKTIEIFSELLEDFRVEALGRKEFPGTLENLDAFHKFTLSQCKIEDLSPGELLFYYMKSHLFGFEIPGEKKKNLLEFINSDRVVFLLERLKSSNELAYIPCTLELIRLIAEKLKTPIIPTDTKIKDESEILAVKIQSLMESEGDLKEGEQRWSPYTLDSDIIEKVKISAYRDTSNATDILKNCRKITTYIVSKLGHILKALNIRNTNFGSMKGSSLSNRRLVHSYTSVISNEYPKTAFYTKEEFIDVSLAGVITIDESGSMSLSKNRAPELILTLLDTFDRLGYKICVTGIQESPEKRKSKVEGFHRNYGVIHHIFKDFNESLQITKGRMMNISANRSTPLSDGIQFGLDLLNSRRENHKILFVLTDGKPDKDHIAVIKNQIRKSIKDGILILGMGFTEESKPVMELFTDSIWAPKVEELPPLFVEKMKSMVSLSGWKFKK
jgi:hypothetical protein